MPDNNLRVIFCDVGQGDGILVTQGYSQMLVDTGANNLKMAECLGRHLPFWDKKIEAVVISHKDGDHSGGLRQVQKFYKISSDQIFLANLRKDDKIEFNDAEFLVLSPDLDWGEDNLNSTVAMFRYHNKRILLMADATQEVEQRLAWRGIIQGPVDVLKVAHHGSAEGTSEELLNATKPVEAVISVGKNNKFGHPTKGVLERLENIGAKVRRTDEEGDIVYMF